MTEQGVALLLLVLTQSGAVKDEPQSSVQAGPQTSQSIPRLPSVSRTLLGASNDALLNQHHHLMAD